jgi:glyoxylase-like metal-dependent hydrolase (beta-lactamase superfamily II)
MKIKKMIVGLFQTNCYLAWDETSKTGVVIDPGGNAAKILENIKEKGVRVEAVLYTHGHRDHAWAGPAIAKKTGAPIFRHPGEPRGFLFSRPLKTDGVKVQDLAHDRQLAFGPLRFTVIHTPGHSPGSVSLYSEGPAFAPAPIPVLFSGDLLFQNGVGRFDIKGASFRELVASLNHRLAHLPDETDVLPGHGPATTLGKERRSNPFFRMARDLKRRDRKP